MVDVKIESWWKATEIPLAETDWRNIRLYCEGTEDPFEWANCVYIIRLSPPFAIAYGDEDIVDSPLLYVGSGKISQRWKSHLEWLSGLGSEIPGGRYEIWVCRPLDEKVPSLYKDVENDIIQEFMNQTTEKYRPLWNKLAGKRSKHEYDKGFFSSVIDSDRRYTWAMYPLERSSAFLRYDK